VAEIFEVCHALSANRERRASAANRRAAISAIIGTRNFARKDPQGDVLQLPLRWRWKLEKLAERVKRIFGGGGGAKQSNARPRLCPACGSLAGTTATKCYQCGASLRFSGAAVTRGLSRMLPTQSPVTYLVLSICCLFYGISLLLTVRLGGSGGGGIFDMGGINSNILIRMGSSLPFPYLVQFMQPWRLVTACFLHGSLMHILFNMWVLMDIGPMLEELYGSARYLFFYVVTGIFGYVASSIWITFKLRFEHAGMQPVPSIGASGALLGLIGLMLAASMRRNNFAAQMMRNQLLKWVVYIFVLGFIFTSTDNAAHFGGLASGFLIGRVVADRAPVDLGEQRRARALGWLAGLTIVVCFGFMFLFFYQMEHLAPETLRQIPSEHVAMIRDARRS
jgi:rhomboid protease GluP